MNSAVRIAQLQQKHAKLEQEIDEASKSPFVRMDGMWLQTLKRQKLAIKDALEQLRRESVIA